LATPAGKVEMPYQAKANLAALIESTEDLIWSVDLDYRLIAFNSAFQKHIEVTFGVRPAEGMRPEDFVPQERANLMPPLYDRARAEGSFRVEFLLADGHTLDLSFNPIVYDGEIIGISVFGKDITERKAAERALREAEKKYRDIYDGALEGIFQTSFEGRPLTANPALARMLGYDSTEDYMATVKDSDHDVWVDPGERARYIQMLEKGGAIRDFECRFKRKDGAVIWVSLNSRKVLGPDGKTFINEGFVQDITERKWAEIKLHDSEERYRTVFQANQDCVNINRLDNGVYVEVNQAFLRITGYQRHEVIGRPSLEIGIWADPADRLTMVQALRQNESCRDLEIRYKKKNGEIFLGLMSASVMELDGVPCIISVTRDITEAKAAEKRLAAATEALRASEERYRATFQLSIDAININRLSDGVFVDVNEAFLQFVGFEREEVIGRTSRELNFWADPEVRQKMVETLRRGESCRDLKARFRKKNGEIVWGQASESILEIDGVPCILSVTRDISAAKAAEELIRDLAFYDPLTRLPNRRLLMERLRQSLAAGSRTKRKRALLFVDLDNFKTLNDTLGHRIGDLMLQEVAVRLAACIRESDTVARLGGDEFIVMLEDLSGVAEEAAAQAESIGEKILAAIDQPFRLSGREWLSTSSIGITVFGDKRESTDEVLQRADIAMYQAKAAGSNTMRFFAPALQAAVKARAALEKDIRQAIKAGQFEIYYQPQLDSIGLVGAEALIRWNHPRRGLLLPGEFIPLAEETGLILPLGDWVLENAFAQVAAWAGRPESSHISLAVNISARQFRQSGFVDKVLAALDRTGANPENIKLELTESMLVDNIEDVIAKMTELKSHGLKFSLDDFGTGYSSLTYLKRLPFDQLKIDSSFVRDIQADAGSRAIAQSVISMGRALGLSVIAECVETEEQRALLSRFGCQAFQGFLFSRALPLEAFEKQWLCSSEFTVPIAG
jgi:diguanylate cyclase (GGDEF)-like protein/PAS domain S-box-containing protein